MAVPAWRPASRDDALMRTPGRSARLLHRYLRTIARRTAWRCIDGSGRSLSPKDLTAVFDLDAHAPTIVTYWVTDSLEVALLPALTPDFARLFRSLRVVVDASFGGRVTGEYVRLLGGSATVLALPGHPDRLTSLRELMADRPSCAFAVDGGGPYHAVSTGIVALAASMRASILPIAVQGRPKATLFHHPSRVRVPLPPHRLVAAIGHAIPIVPSTDRPTTVTALANALEALQMAASARLAHG